MSEPKPLGEILVDEIVQRCEQFYLKTKNPIFVWEAMSWSVGQPGRLPDFVLEYLGRCSHAIMELANRAAVEGPPESIAQKVSKAMELSQDGGGHGALHQYARTRRDLDLQADMKALRGGPGAAVSKWAAAKALAPSYDLCDPKSVLEALRRLSALDLPDQDRELEGFYRQWNKRQVIRD